MRLRSLSYYTREAFISLFRNRLMALASIMTVMSCIFILSFSYCLAANIDYILEQLESSLNLSVHLNDDMPAASVPTLAGMIEKLPNVKSVKYISAEEALESFRGSLGPDDQHLLDGFDEDNPLPRTFVVSLDDTKNQQAVVTELEKLKQYGVGEIQYDQQIINVITSLNTGIRIVSIVIIAALIAISVVIIMNTIKITVNSRRTEIVIMKYIGATDWFIRWPFIIEGILIGVIGALIPVALCWLGYTGAVQAVYENLRVLENLVDFRTSASIFLVLLPMGLAIGTVIGSAGSVWSLRKHLNV